MVLLVILSTLLLVWLAEVAVEELVTPVLDDPRVIEEESEAVMSVAEYVPLLPGVENTLLGSTVELVPRIRELRLLKIPPVLEGEATG